MVTAAGAAATSDTASGVLRVSPVGRRLRFLVLAVLAVLVAVGSAIGSDDDFPLGPLRMFAGAEANTGTFSTPYLVGTDTAGRTWVIPDTEVGFKHSELRGDLHQLISEPSLVAGLAAEYDHRFPDRPPLVQLQVVRRVYHIVNRAYVGQTQETVARWQQS